MGSGKPEQYFLKNLLQIGLVGVCIVLIADISLIYHDTISVTIDLIILCSVVGSLFFLRRKMHRASVLMVTVPPLGTMVYQGIISPDSTIPLTVILTIGFAYSILLRGKIRWYMHMLTILALIYIFAVQLQNHPYYLKESLSQALAVAITYLVLYVIITVSAGALKSRYDRINQALKSANHELIEKSTEIMAQNEQLTLSQQKLHSLNQLLEQTIEVRTQQINQKNEQLLKYAYTNAHHVRGPVARVLGLIQLSKIDHTVELPFVVEKIEDETREIDSIISRINAELEKVHN